MVEPLTKAEVQLRARVLLTAQVALLGEVGPALRGVGVGWSETTLVVRGVMDGPVGEEDRESIECVGTELVAGFPEHTLVVEVVRTDAPAGLSEEGIRAWVYRRRER